jgi:hypothetical protein
MMPPKRNCPKKLLVEGAKDCRLIPYLIEALGLFWGPKGAEIVGIDACGSFTELIRPGVIDVEIKRSGLTHLGIVVDADVHLLGRWQSVTAKCRQYFPDIPQSPPANGFVTKNDEGKRMGIWIMPDNQSSGMVETFLQMMLHDEDRQLHLFAKECARAAKAKGATYRDCHFDKAVIHTWLAWQDEPGAQLHEAVVQRLIRPGKAVGDSFFRWFCDLYEECPPTKQ